VRSPRLTAGRKVDVRRPIVRLKTRNQVRHREATDTAKPRRYEVAHANTNDLITFASSLQGTTITLTSGPITINESLTIANFIGSQVTVSGGGKKQVFVVNTPSGSSTSIDYMTITGGVAPIGGGILNEGGGTSRTRQSAVTPAKTLMTWSQAGMVTAVPSTSTPTARLMIRSPK
jgi:hypothetical protein